MCHDPLLGKDLDTIWGSGQLHVHEVMTVNHRLVVGTHKC
jgi:hypothetical protein